MFTIILSGFTANAFGISTSLAWLPLSAIFLWPRWSHPFVTPILIAVLGLFADLLLGRFLGLSSLIFLIFFWIAKPTEREVRLSLLKGWVEFALIVILLLMVLFYILGRSLDLTIGWMSLSEQIIITIAAFPLIFGLRAAARAWLIDPHDANYQS